MRVESFRSVRQLAGSFAVEQPGSDGPFACRIGMPKWKYLWDGEKTLRLTGEFVFEGLSSPDETVKPFVQITAVFEADYGLQPGDSIDEKDIAAFASVNGLLNLQSFWREFVCSCLARAGLPPVLIPPFNPVKSGLVRPRPEATASEGTSSGTTQ